MAAQFGHELSHDSTPFDVQVTTRGLGLDLLATMTVRGAVFCKHGPFTTAPGVVRSSLAFDQMPRTVSKGRFVRFACSGLTVSGE